MKCPNCEHPLSPTQIKSLWGKLCQSRAGKVDPAKAIERSKKANAAKAAKALLREKS